MHQLSATARASVRGVARPAVPGKVSEKTSSASMEQRAAQQQRGDGRQRIDGSDQRLRRRLDRALEQLALQRQTGPRHAPTVEAAPDDADEAAGAVIWVERTTGRRINTAVRMLHIALAAAGALHSRE